MARHLQVTLGSRGFWGVWRHCWRCFFSISWVLAWRIIDYKLELSLLKKSQDSTKKSIPKNTLDLIKKIPTEDTFVNLKLIIVSAYRLDPRSHPGCKGWWQMKGLGRKVSKTLVVMSQHRGCGGFRSWLDTVKMASRNPKANHLRCKNNLVDINWDLIGIIYIYQLLQNFFDQ